ncbi:hypothetical protein [Rummeliibacillus stabekisii]|uniref:hypothetical protein n=1 Tax=Rummeliibacillus stabekisii TaxID=241244 RepID=UPI003710F914
MNGARNKSLKELVLEDPRPNTLTKTLTNAVAKYLYDKESFDEIDENELFYPINFVKSEDKPFQLYVFEGSTVTIATCATKSRVDFTSYSLKGSRLFLSEEVNSNGLTLTIIPADGVEIKFNVFVEADNYAEYDDAYEKRIVDIYNHLRQNI